MKIQKFTIFLILFLFLLFLPKTVFAGTPTPAVDTGKLEDVIDSFQFDAKTPSTGLLKNTEMHLNSPEGDTEKDFWNKVYTEYKGIIIGISGIATLTFVLIFIFSFIKLGQSAGNPQNRKNAQVALLWCGIGAALSGSVMLWVGFGYNLFRNK